MIRKIGLLLSIAAITASTLIACNKHDDNNKPEVTTVIVKPNGECIGYDKCPPVDGNHITATLNPQTITTNVEVPTVVPSTTSVMVPTVSTSP